MKIVLHFIPRVIIFSLIFFSAYSVASQTIDSVKYSNGFLYFHEYGKGEPVILLSGGPGNNCSQLSEMARMLSDKYKIILLEQRGTGRSIPEPFDSTTVNLSTAVSDLSLLLDKLKLTKAIICGHSWGASLAMYFASVHPEKVKALILIAPAFLSLGNDLAEDFSNNMLARWSISERQEIDSLGQRQANQTATEAEIYRLKYLLRLPYVSKKERLDSLIKKIDVQRNQKTLLFIYKDTERTIIDFRQSLKELRGPIFLICGRQDLLAASSFELKTTYPKISMNWIQDCGHFPMFEQPQKFYPIVRNAIDGLKLRR